MRIPAVLPFARFIRQVEALPEPRKADADRQCRVAQPVVALVGAVLAGVFEVGGERRASREDEATGERGNLVAELGFRTEAVAAVVALVWLDQGVHEIAERAPAARAAAELHQAIGAERPAGRGLDRKAQACEPRPAGGRLSLEQDPLRALHLGKKHLVTQPEPRQRAIVRERNGGQRARLRADDHRAVGERREPVVAVAYVELRPIEAGTDHRAGRDRVIGIGRGAETDEDVIARLPVRLHARQPLAVVARTVPVGQWDDCAIVRGNFGACLHQPDLAHVTVEIAADARAQRGIDAARGRQRILHGRGGDRTRGDRLIGQDQHALDLPLDLGRQVQG